VYRLVSANTVEERIIQRADEKSIVQQTVYTGKLGSRDFFKGAQEVASLLSFDDEDDAQDQLEARMREKLFAKRKKKREEAAEEAKTVVAGGAGRGGTEAATGRGGEDRRAGGREAAGGGGALHGAGATNGATIDAAKGRGGGVDAVQLPCPALGGEERGVSRTEREGEEAQPVSRKRARGEDSNGGVAEGVASKVLKIPVSPVACSAEGSAAGGQLAGGPTDMEITTAVVASVNANGTMR
jgi:hypothetical protein